jgi:hypothetical protein
VSTTSVETGGKHTIRSPLNPNLFSKIFRNFIRLSYCLPFLIGAAKVIKFSFPPNFYFKIFSQEPESIFCLPSLFYRGGKSTSNFRFNPNLFSKIFIYSFLSLPPPPFFIGAAKVIHLISSFQIYFHKFLSTSKTRFPFVSKNVSISEKRVQK